MTGIVHRSQLRPLERAILRHAESGRSPSEIAWRFRRSPGHVDRILQLAEVPRSTDRSAAASDVLRPVERCVLRARAEGADSQEIAARLRRTPDHVERIEQYATYKLARR